MPHRTLLTKAASVESRLKGLGDGVEEQWELNFNTDEKACADAARILKILANPDLGPHIDILDAIMATHATLRGVLEYPRTMRVTMRPLDVPSLKQFMEGVFPALTLVEIPA